MALDERAKEIFIPWGKLTYFIQTLLTSDSQPISLLVFHIQ